LSYNTDKIIKCIQLIIPDAIATYYNKCYISLIKEDDEYVIQKFKEMKEYKNHSEICLSNILFFKTLKIYKLMSVEKIDYSQHERYMKSTEKEIKEKIKELNLIDKLSHECKGKNIKECNPNEKIFHMAIKQY
jgi:hypothetical protein